MSLTYQVIRDQAITALMVTHRLEEALIYGDRLMVLKEGKIVLDERDKAKLTLEDLKKILEF